MKRIDQAELQRAFTPQAERLLIERVALAFRQYSSGRAQLARAGHLHFDAPPGDVHIKSAALSGSQTYTVKIASGFYENWRRDLPPSDGLMLVFDQQNGQPLAMLFDRGWLTDLRTAAAGALCVRLCAPEQTKTVAMLGAGVQARMQLRFLAYERSFRRVQIWSRSNERAAKLADELAAAGIDAEVFAKPGDALRGAELLYCTTASRSPLFAKEEAPPELQATIAIGADNAGKQELAPEFLAAAGRIIVDSRAQSEEFGELNNLRAAALSNPNILELGEVLETGEVPDSASGITICALTGLGVQDAAVAELSLELLAKSDTNL